MKNDKSTFPSPEDQEALQDHFRTLRDQCKPDMESHEEEFKKPMGEEII